MKKMQTDMLKKFETEFRRKLPDDLNEKFKLEIDEFHVITLFICGKACHIFDTHYTDLVKNMEDFTDALVRFDTDDHKIHFEPFGIFIDYDELSAMVNYQMSQAHDLTIALNVFVETAVSFS